MLNLYKPISKTPLEVINQLKAQNLEYNNVKMAYAGRLDPMAHGVLLILTGEECKQRDIFQDLNKEYEFEIIFGIETDTLDIMGRINTFAPHNVDETKLHAVVSRFPEQFEFDYPLYSSKTVSGKPLYYWARSGKINEIEIPKKVGQIYNINYIDKYSLDLKEILNLTTKRITATKGDFRQLEIMSDWENYVGENKELEVEIYKFKITVSSGTYVRSVVENIAKQLGTKGIAFDIKRTKVGDFTIGDCIYL